MVGKLSVAKKAILAVIIANIIWGSAAAVFKVSLTNIPPFTLAFWRFFIGALLLLLYLGKHASMPMQGRRDWLLLVGYALTGITINILFFFWGLQLTYSINAPVIASGAPILTLILALIFLKETFSWRKLWGMLFGTAGILLIVLEPLLDQGIDGSILGNVFLVIAVAAAVVQTIIGKKALTKFAALPFTFWAFLVGAASFLPLAVFEYVQTPTIYAALDWRGYMGLAFGAVLSSAVAYGLYAWGLSKISATDTSMFTYLDPIVGTVIGAAFLHEPVTGLFLIGALLIFMGIGVAEGRVHHPASKLRKPKPAISTSDIAPLTEAENRPKADKHEVLKQIFEKPQS
jgi:drug/metabolite transporter (DMT)-like permease